MVTGWVVFFFTGFTQSLQKGLGSLLVRKHTKKPGAVPKQVRFPGAGALLVDSQLVIG